MHGKYIYIVPTIENKGSIEKMLPMAFVRVRYYLQGSKTGFCKIKKRACAETDDCLVIRTCPTKNIIHSCKFYCFKRTR